MIKGRRILPLIIIMSFFISLLTPVTMAQMSDEKKAALKRYIELLDSGDYVIILINDRKIRAREKPEVDAKDLVKIYIRKSSGSYHEERINKSTIDFEKTEEYNNKLKRDRDRRQAALDKKRAEREARLAAERKESAKLKDDVETAKVYTARDLKNKNVGAEILNISDVADLDEYPGWTVIISVESPKWENQVFSVNKRNGEVIFSGTLKDLMDVKDYIRKQSAAYETKIQELYAKGTAEGDKFKYSGMVVGIQAILQDLKTKNKSIEAMMEKLPPRPEEPTE